MKKECIFKCFAQGEWWYVYAMDYGILGVRYRIYKGRRWYCHADFETMPYAICAAVNAVSVGLDGCSFEVESRV